MQVVNGERREGEVEGMTAGIGEGRKEGRRAKGERWREAGRQGRACWLLVITLSEEECVWRGRERVDIGE